MKALCAALLVCVLPARAEEIRIEVARGLAHARLDQHALEVRDGKLFVDGKSHAGALVAVAAHLDGRALPGKLEVFADGGGLVAVNTLDLEEYVAAVVASEVPGGWPDEALRAQAVAARTFAVAQKIAQGPGARAHLGASVLDQVYKYAPSAAAQQAARATAGQVLTWGASPIAAWFSASCGGVSESAEAAFSTGAGSTPYIQGGSPDDDEGAPKREWTVHIPLAELTAALKKADRVRGEVESLRVVSRTASGRAKTVRLEAGRAQASLSAVELRQLLGYTRLPSLLFEVAVEGGEAVFTGRGSGHGVGLCQWGARGRARRGQGYREILAHYYPGAEIRRMY